jgi:transcriptional regulator with XRE-family HTH domain
MTWGTKLITYRKKLRLSQYEVAEQVGVSQAAYSTWEADTVIYKVNYLPKLAKAFGVSPVDLIPNQGDCMKV